MTIDEDVAVQLERLRRTRNSGLKQIVNEVLRRGLGQMASPEEYRKPHQTKTVSLGRCLIGDIDAVAETLAIADGQTLR